MVKVKKDLTGKQFGNLIVVGQGDDYISPGGRHFISGTEHPLLIKEKIDMI